MKKFSAAVALALLIAKSASSASPSEVVIMLERSPNNPRHHTASMMTLSQSPRGFRCKTASVPEHQIHVKGLSSLQAPNALTKSQKVLSNCETVLAWGTNRVCYQKDAYPLIDEIIRWCTSI